MYNEERRLRSTDCTKNNYKLTHSEVDVLLEQF